jgi:hypothetical protein
MHNILNYHNVAIYCKFDARGTVVPNTATASAPAVDIKMAHFTRAQVLVVCFGSKKQSLLHKFKGNFELSIAKNLIVGL